MRTPSAPSRTTTASLTPSRTTPVAVRHARTLQRDSELTSKEQTDDPRPHQPGRRAAQPDQRGRDRPDQDRAARARCARAFRFAVDDAWQAWVRVKSTLSSVGSLELVEADVIDDMDALDALLSESRREVAAFVKDYADDVSRTSVVVDDLQEHGMRLRMLPANTIFHTFPRAMRDLAKQFHKESRAASSRAATPNSTRRCSRRSTTRSSTSCATRSTTASSRPPMRVAAGKPALGTITPGGPAGGRPHRHRDQRRRRGHRPGRSPRDRRAQGLHHRGRGHVACPTARLTYLIFEAGFSTAAIITEISGRGVGMDVVRRVRRREAQGLARRRVRDGQGHDVPAHHPAHARDHPRAAACASATSIFAMPTGIDRRDAARRRRGDPQGRGARGHPPAAPRRSARAARRHPRRHHSDPPPDKVPIATIGFSGHRMGFIVDSFVGEQQIVIKTLGDASAPRSRTSRASRSLVPARSCRSSTCRT